MGAGVQLAWHLLLQAAMTVLLQLLPLACVTVQTGGQQMLQNC
jgi:hypothetical protein